MEKLILNYLNHLDLNHNGIADVKEIKPLYDKLIPLLRKFGEADGFHAIERTIEPMLSPEAKAAIDEANAVFDVYFKTVKPATK